MHQSGDAAVNFGNTPPTAVGGVTLVEEKVVVTPVSGRHRSFKLGEYFSDTPGDTLHYVIVSSQLVSDTAAIDGDTLNVETSKSRSGDLVIAAVDAQGAQTQITFRFKVTNLTLAMDDRFPELFQAVQHQPDFGQAVTVAEYYFLFVRQVFNSDRERIGRLRAVVDWAERNGKHLIVQSDLTNGNVSGSGPEGYQAAANVMVIVNSQDDNRLGQGLEAAIWGAGSSAVWSLSADRKVKETDEIACAAMEQILTECLEQAGAAGGQSNIQETLCGAQQDYDSLFREYIDEKELLPDLPTFLQYLPYTKEMEALEQSLSDAPTRGLLGRLRSRPSDTIDGDKLINAVASVGDIWGLCVNQYYGRCVQELKENAERVQEYFKQLLCSRLFYGAMNATLQQEAVNLETRTDWHEPMNMRRGTLAECLHRYACSQVLPEVYGFLAGQLCAAMKDVSEYADCGPADGHGSPQRRTAVLHAEPANPDPEREQYRRGLPDPAAGLCGQALCLSGESGKYSLQRNCRSKEGGVSRCPLQGRM